MEWSDLRASAGPNTAMSALPSKTAFSPQPFSLLTVFSNSLRSFTTSQDNVTYSFTLFYF